MKGVGLRALGDPTPIDRADMYSRATIAGQSFQSGEINGRDSFGFRLPVRAVHVHQGDPRRRPLRRARDDDDRRDPHELARRSPAPTTTSTCASGRTCASRSTSALYNDFERGDRDTYSVPIDAAVLAGLKVGDITRVQIEKSPDGVGGGWRLRGVKLVVNGRTLYRRDGIERWLEDDHRTWRAPDFTPTRRRAARRCRSRSTCGTRTRTSTAATTTATSTATTTAAASRSPTSPARSSATGRPGAASSAAGSATATRRRSRTRSRRSRRRPRRRRRRRLRRPPPPPPPPPPPAARRRSEGPTS